MDWGDLTLRLVRGAGVLAGAAAGVAALLTEGAFERRQQPLQGLWKDTPLGTYRLTRWGGILLAVILSAPTVQFVGDWIKDENDSRTLGNTAVAIRQDIDNTVATTTERSHSDIIAVVRTESQAQAEASVRTSNQLSDVAAAAGRTLAQAERILQPLSDVRASFWFRVPLLDPDLQEFRSRFISDVQPLITQWEAAPSSSPNFQNGAYPSVREMNGKVTTVEVEQGSSLFPRENSEKFAYTIFHDFDVTLYFYRHPIDISKFPHFGYFSADKMDPDLEMNFFAPDDVRGKLALEYQPKDQTFKVRGSSVSSDSKYWNSSGQIIAFPDLVGAQVFIIGAHLSVSFDEPNKRVQPDLDVLSLDIGSLRGLWLRRDQLSAHSDSASGGTVYEYRFPPTQTELQSTLK